MALSAGRDGVQLEDVDGGLWRVQTAARSTIDTSWPPPHPFPRRHRTAVAPRIGRARALSSSGLPRLPVLTAPLARRAAVRAHLLKRRAHGIGPRPIRAVRAAIAESTGRHRRPPDPRAPVPRSGLSRLPVLTATLARRFTVAGFFASALTTRVSAVLESVNSMSRIWGHRGIPPVFSLGARPSRRQGSDSVSLRPPRLLA